MTTPTGFAPQRPMIGLQGQNSGHANRNAIASMMGTTPFGGTQNGFGMAPRPAPNYGPPDSGQMPIPPSLNFTPGVGTSSPSMTAPPTAMYRPPPPPMDSNPMFQPGAPTIQPYAGAPTGRMQIPLPVRPTTRG